MGGVKAIPFLGDFINGEFHLSEKFDGAWSLHSPANVADKYFEPSYVNDHVHRACEAAAEAYKSWRYSSIEERSNLLRRLQEEYIANEKDLAQVISRETGKPLWESANEVKAMAGKIGITLDSSMRRVQEQRIENALPNIDGVVRYKSRGVMAVIGPFNFPGHLPNGHIVPALACGNTVVFKPSDKTPAVGQMMARMFRNAGFPPGVFNLVQGRGETGKRLVGHALVSGVLFTGSYDVGLKIKQETLTHHNKILALEMGGKNCAIVWEDAHLEKAIYENIVGAFLTSGQRCSGTSKIILHPKIKDKFIESFYQTAKKLSIGHYQDNPFMGPLISSESVEKYIRFQEIAKREGAESLMRGKALELPWDGHYVTPSIYWVPQFDSKSIYQSCEIFAPNVALLETNDFDEAIAINNSTGFGLVMSLFSNREELYKKSLVEANVGLVNWNRTTNGASSRLPFGGMGKSGNDRPSGDFAVDYCTVPVASLEDKTELDYSKLLPGVDYEYLGG